MIEEMAIVAAVSDNRVWVEASTVSACGGCAQKAGCSTSLLDRHMRKRRIAVDTDFALRPGDRVIVGLDEGALVRGSLLIYLVPLVGLFLGGIVGESLSVSLGLPDTERTSVVSAIGGFLLSLLIINRMQRSFLPQFLAKPVVLRKL